MAAQTVPITPVFDPAAYKATTRTQWQQAAKAWNDWGPLLGRWLGPATELMLDMAEIGPGQRVLDVAAGAGEQTLRIAQRVGPQGHVLATDIAPNILAFAADALRCAGCRQCETRVMDGEALEVDDAAFDAVVSRVGLIYLPDQVKALSGMRRAVKPGGRVAAIVYGPAEANGFFATPVSIIRRRAQLPPPLPGQPGPFSLGAPGVLEDLYRRAGFDRVETVSVSAPLRLASAAECVRFEKDSFGALHQMLAGLDESARQAAWDEIEEALQSYETGDGFVGPCELIVAVGIR